MVVVGLSRFFGSVLTLDIAWNIFLFLSCVFDAHLKANGIAYWLLVENIRFDLGLGLVIFSIIGIVWGRIGLIEYQLEASV